MPEQKNEHFRLVLPTLVVSAALLIVGSLAASYLHSSQRESSHVLTRNINRVRATEELMLLGEQLQLAYDQSLLTGVQEPLQSLPTLRQEVDQWLDRSEELSISPRDQEYVNLIREGFVTFNESLDNAIAESGSADQQPINVTHLNQVFEQQILKPARDYRRFNRNRLDELTARHQTLSNRMGLALMLLGTCGAIAGLLAGMTVSKSVQRRLLDNQRNLARSEQLATLGRIAGALAHELRNPLTSMRIIVQSVAADEDSNADSPVSIDFRDFTILRDEIERLDDSIQTFLDYARPPRPEKRSCTVQSLLRNSIALVDRRAQQIDVKIHDELPADPIEIQADPGQLKQVFLNVIINALDAMPDGGQLTIGANVGSPDELQLSQNKLRHFPNVVEINISDSGSGLSEDLRSRIFEAFVSSKETGTGLGLAVSKRIMDDHDGEIEATNAVEQGTLFTIRLPKENA